MFLIKSILLQTGLISFIILVGDIVVAQESQCTITFDKAFEQMHKNSHVLKQSEYVVKEKEAERKAMTSIRMPRVSITANAIQMADRLELDLTPVRDAINPLYSALGNYGVFSRLSICSTCIDNCW